jgi:hypothetical protein
MASVHYGDVGTVFQLVLTRDGAVFDISTASVKQLKFRFNDNQLKVKTASFTTNGTDGKLQYTTIAGDLDCLGSLSIQAYVEVSGGKWSSDAVGTEVAANL